MDPNNILLVNLIRFIVDNGFCTFIYLRFGLQLGRMAIRRKLVTIGKDTMLALAQGPIATNKRYVHT